jgi:hypothetical protein
MLPPYFPRFGDRLGLVVYAAAKAGAVPERFGLGAALVVLGRSVIDAVIVVPDDSSEEKRADVEDWARSHRVKTMNGHQRWQVMTLSEFSDPRHGLFMRIAYSGAGWVVGADLGRTFGLMAEHVTERNGRNADSWQVWLQGWGVEHERGRIMRASPHRPPLRLTSRRVGWQVEFAPSAKGFGKYVDGHQWRGAFIDVLSLAYALDAQRGASYGEHRAQAGSTPTELPVAVEVSAEGAAEIAAAVESLHEFAVVLDEHSAHWFTSLADRKEGRGRVDLAHTVSPGRLASDLLGRAGLQAPMKTFSFSDDEQAQWCETFHGGRCQAHHGLVGHPFEGVSVDVSGCFPRCAHLIGWWDLITAKRVKRVDVTEELRTLCAQAALDPCALMDPAVWRRFGCCLVEVVPGGEVLPAENEDDDHPEGRLVFAPLHSPERSFYFSALDVLAAAVESWRVPEIIFSATAYVPVGRQSGMKRRLPVLPGLVLDLDADPVMALVAARRQSKADGDHVLAAELRVILNALVYGIFSRFDEHLLKRGRTWERGERPGPWNCMALASSVTAGSHLLLALLKRLAGDRGGVVAYMDTDSGIIPATNDGAELTLPDGSVIHQLSLKEIDEILGAFAPLAPAPAWPLWRRVGRDETVRAVIFGLKRHAAIDSKGQLVDMTEAGLGGTFIDPDTMTGLGGLGYRCWSEAAVSREVALSHARQSDREALRPGAPWDATLIEPLPALRRFSVRHPSQLHALPNELGSRPGTPYLECSGSWIQPDRVYVALDPGGDRSGWQGLDWRDKHTGECANLSTDLARYDLNIVESLNEWAIRYSKADRTEPIESVHVDPTSITHRGRVSGLVDAIEDGLSDFGSFRPLYDAGDRAAAVTNEVRRLGPEAFRNRYNVPPDTAKRISAGRPPSARVVAHVVEAMRTAGADAVCQLNGCGERLGRSNSLYCSKAHRDRAYRERRKERSRIGVSPPQTPQGDTEEAAVVETVCPSCGDYLLGTYAPGELCPDGQKEPHHV